MCDKLIKIDRNLCKNVNVEIGRNILIIRSDAIGESDSMCNRTWKTNL